MTTDRFLLFSTPSQTEYFVSQGLKAGSHAMEMYACGVKTGKQTLVQCIADCAKRVAVGDRCGKIR
jgi:hypothetical protein